MNLMFRKNFREQKSGGGGGKGTLNKSSSSRHANKRLNREQGYTPIEEQYYRTHLFFSPRSARSTYNINETEEPRCGPMTGTVGHPSPLQSISPPMSETDLPQPLVIRSPSETLMRWPSTPTKTTPTRQANFNRADGHSEIARTLSELDRDCFIIPVHSLDRFLPAGVPLPKSTSGGNAEKSNQGGLNVLQIKH